MNPPALRSPNEMPEKVFHDLGVWREEYGEEMRTAGTMLSENKQGSCSDWCSVRGKDGVTLSAC